MEETSNIPRKPLKSKFRVELGSHSEVSKCEVLFEHNKMVLKLEGLKAFSKKLLAASFNTVFVEDKLHLNYCVITKFKGTKEIEIEVLNCMTGKKVAFVLFGLQSKGLLFNSNLDEYQVRGISAEVNKVIMFHNQCFIESFFELSNELEDINQRKGMCYGVDYRMSQGMNYCKEYYDYYCAQLEKRLKLKEEKTREISKSFTMPVKEVKSLFGDTKQAEKTEEDLTVDFGVYAEHLKDRALVEVKNFVKLFFSAVNCPEDTAKIEKVSNHDASARLRSLFKGETVEQKVVKKPENIFGRRLKPVKQSKTVKKDKNGFSAMTLENMKKNDFGDKLKNLYKQEEEDFVEPAGVVGEVKLKKETGISGQLSYKEVLDSITALVENTQLNVPDSLQSVLSNCVLLIFRMFVKDLLREHFEDNFCFESEPFKPNNVKSVCDLVLSVRRIKLELEKNENLVVESKNNLFR